MIICTLYKNGKQDSQQGWGMPHIGIEIMCTKLKHLKINEAMVQVQTVGMFSVNLYQGGKTAIH